MAIRGIQPDRLSRVACYAPAMVWASHRVFAVAGGLNDARHGHRPTVHVVRLRSYFERYLSTSGLPDPDLIIRTAGEMRLSNFLLWQSAYAEYYSTPVLWPDFDEEQVNGALAAFSSRQRRYGKVLPSPLP